MPLKHVNNTSNVCFQDRKVIASAVKSVFFVKISAFLHTVCLLFFFYFADFRWSIFGKIIGQR
ncbi:hypothetical protein HMPREF9304_04350 [Hoylesella timonensis S9-PR14]|uniref:Uncharacterized protein n=1 Tax=Hoylesella timonensis S9-PR14 TaxID=1401062 RepID=A0A098YRR8_9BACT|nr:hypothetical protein HMPREF9304_04350 [Hoylesella timonensis S9-PR14]